MNYHVKHITEYTYREEAGICHNIARLVPRNTPEQECRNIKIEISPQPGIMNEYEDFFGNKIFYFAIQQRHKKLRVMVSSDITKKSNVHAQIELYQPLEWEKTKRLLQELGTEYVDVKQYIPETPMTAVSAAITAYALRSFTPGISVFDATNDLMRRIYNDFEFKPGHTMVATPLAEVMKQRKGVCQDFAHLAIACVKSVGLPARYMSGYIETLPPPGAEKLTGADASHAWFAVYIPGMGWAEFDPTNNQIPADQHITIGWGRDYADIAPLKGIMFGSDKHDLNVSVDVKRTGG